MEKANLSARNRPSASKSSPIRARRAREHGTADEAGDHAANTGAVYPGQLHRGSSTPVGHDQKSGSPQDGAARWGAIMYPSTSRQRHSPAQGEAYEGLNRAASVPPSATAGTQHALSSVQLQVTTGEDMELQELASVARQRVPASTHPRPTSRTMGVLGRHDSTSGVSRTSGSPATGSGSTPVGARPGSGTRHQNDPYNSISPIKVLSPVGSGHSPPQPLSLTGHPHAAMAAAAAPPLTRSGYTAAADRYGALPGPSHTYRDPFTGHNMEVVASGQPALMRGEYGAAAQRANGGESGGYGPAATAAGGSDFYSQSQSHTNAMSSVTGPGAGSSPGSRAAPIYQPPPPFFLGQDAPSQPNTMYGGAHGGARGPSSYAPTHTPQVGPYRPPHQSMRPCELDVDLPHNSSSGPSVGNLKGQGGAPLPQSGPTTVPGRRGKATVVMRRETSGTGLSPQPSVLPAGGEMEGNAAGSASSAGVEGQAGPGVLYPPISAATVNDVLQWVYQEEPHLDYPLIVLPDSALNHGENEDRQRRIEQRRKQIQYGRETEGYQKYRTVIPDVGQREFHNVDHPITPRPEYDCSKRTFDKLLNEWRRKLHRWDECDLNDLQPPFLPLGAVTLADLHLAPPSHHGQVSAATDMPVNRHAQSAPPHTADRTTAATTTTTTPASAGSVGGGGMLSIATHATAAMHMPTNSPVRAFSRDGTGMVSTGSFRNNPYGATSARSGVSSSPVVRMNSGSPGSALFPNTSSSFVLTLTANGRTSTCTPSQGPKVDANFFSPTSSSSRAGSPAMNSGLVPVGTNTSGNDNFVELGHSHDGSGWEMGSASKSAAAVAVGAGNPRGSGRGFHRSGSSSANQGPYSVQQANAYPSYAPAPYAHHHDGPAGTHPSQAGGGNMGAQVDAGHHATPFHHERTMWAGGTPRTPHHNHVLNGPKLFEFDSANSPIVGSGMSGGGGGFTPQNQYRGLNGQQTQQQQQQQPLVPSVPPIPSFSTPTNLARSSGGIPQHNQSYNGGFLAMGSQSLTGLQNGLSEGVAAPGPSGAGGWVRGGSHENMRRPATRRGQ